MFLKVTIAMSASGFILNAVPVMQSPIFYSKQPLISTMPPQMPAQQQAPHKSRKFKFTAEEDMNLKKLVGKHGTNKWSFIAKLLHGRTPRQCRDRWNHYLSHESKELAWTEEDDEQLMRLYNEVGTKWTMIATHFEGRNAVSIRNRACRLIRKQNKPKFKKGKQEEEQTSPQEEKESASEEYQSDDVSPSSPVQKILLPSCRSLPFPVPCDGFFPGQVSSLLPPGLVF